MHDFSFKKLSILIIINKYNNTYHRTIKLKPVDVKSNTYIDSSKEINEKDPKFVILLES